MVRPKALAAAAAVVVVAAWVGAVASAVCPGRVRCWLEMTGPDDWWVLQLFVDQ